MSCNYAEGLSPYHDKGQLGLAERFDNDGVLHVKIDLLAKMINKAKHVVIHSGAGISTSAGIPDFRGPQGVWTLEAKGQKPNMSKDFNEAVPTATHMAISRLVESGKVKYVVSQNIDGLHLRSGLARKYLSELHGNMFIEQCSHCHRQFVRQKAVPTVGQKCLNKACPTIKPNGRACRGRLHDTILDWEHNLPENDLAMADFNSCLADLSIAIGTTMQIVPSGSLPLYTKKAGGKLVIINLQPTKHDTKADLLIHGYADSVMVALMKQLSLRIPKYSAKNDPTQLTLTSDRYFEWTISDAATAQMKKIYEAQCGKNEAKKRLELIEKDQVPLFDRIVRKNDNLVITKRRAEHKDEDDDDDLPLVLRVKSLSDKGRKRKPDEITPSPKPTRKSRRVAEEISIDSDIEIVEETPRKRGRPKKNAPLPATTPTKLYIKKSAVTSNKTKYEIVRPKPSKPTKIEIVHAKDGDAVADLEMVCESDDDGSPIVPFITNFRRYLHGDTTFKREQNPRTDITPSTTIAVKDDAVGEDIKDVAETVKSDGGEVKDVAETVKSDSGEVKDIAETVKSDSGEVKDIVETVKSDGEVKDIAETVKSDDASISGDVKDIAETVKSDDASISGDVKDIAKTVKSDDASISGDVKDIAETVKYDDASISGNVKDFAETVKYDDAGKSGNVKDIAETVKSDGANYNRKVEDIPISDVKKDDISEEGEKELHANIAAATGEEIAHKCEKNMENSDDCMKPQFGQNDEIVSEEKKLTNESAKLNEMERITESKTDESLKPNTTNKNVEGKSNAETVYSKDQSHVESVTENFEREVDKVDSEVIEKEINASGNPEDMDVTATDEGS